MSTAGLLLLLAAALLLLAAGAGLFALLTNFRRGRTQKPAPRALLPYLPQLAAAGERLRGLGLRDVWTESEGFRLHGAFLDCGGSKCAVLVHGIGGRGQDRFLDAPFYLARGYSLLFPDCRGHGRSEGRFYGMGQYERRDLLQWTAFARRRLGPDCRFVFDGISMGAASVLLAAGDGGEPQLRAVVADSGFSDAREEIASVLRARRLPRQPLLGFLRLWGRLLMGYDLRDASPRVVLPGCRVPVLFLHGEADAYVPCSMAEELYAACGGPKAIYLVPGAGHVASRVTDRAGCEAAMAAFLAEQGLAD